MEPEPCGKPWIIAPFGYCELSTVEFSFRKLLVTRWGSLMPNMVF